MFVKRNVSFDDLEDAQFVADLKAALAARALAEFIQLAQAPLGFDVARREHGDENRDVRDPPDERLCKDIIALQLFIAPDSHLLAEQLAETHFQGFVKSLDPSLESFGQRLVVNVCV